MIYPLNAPLVELLLLSIIAKEDSYGYSISQHLKRVSNLKDSALYPILKKLSDQEYVEVYDRQHQGRNRKYYKITKNGNARRVELKTEWFEYCNELNEIIEEHKSESFFEGGNNNE